MKEAKEKKTQNKHNNVKSECRQKAVDIEMMQTKAKTLGRQSKRKKTYWNISFHIFNKSIFFFCFASINMRFIYNIYISVTGETMHKKSDCVSTLNILCKLCNKFIV